MEYACEIRALSANPLKQVKWTKPRTLRTVDPRAVINPDQARRFLDAVHAQGPRGERLVAFFGCMYYAALRPEEVIDLKRDHLVSLPTSGWGEMRLTHSEPRSGTRWTDSGKSRERRALKHRPPGETRSVPIHPELAALLRNHQKQYPPFVTGGCSPVPAAGSSQSGPTWRCSTRRDRPRSPKRKRRHLSWAGPTTCGMPPSPHG
jgi:integrase